VRSLDSGRWPDAPATAAPVVAAPRPAPPAPARLAPKPTRSAPAPVAPKPTPPVPAASAPPAAPALVATPPPVPAPALVAPPTPAAIAAPRTAPPSFGVPATGALRAVEITPVELADDGLVAWEVAGEQRTRVHYRAIEAIAAAEVAGLGDAGVIVIDLVLRTTRPGRPRSSLRMRADGFDPAALFPDRTDAGQALRALLSELLDRSGALPLPDPDSALALRPRRFESLAAFEAATLARLSSGGDPRS